MITALGLGAGLGIGLWALAVGLFPPRPSLRAVLARVTMPPAPPPILTTGEAGWSARLGRPFVAALQALGLPGTRLRRDLAVLGRPAATHLAQQATGALAGLLAPLTAQLLLGLGGLSVGVGFPVIAALTLGVLGFLVPDQRVRTEAARLRTDFRHGLSAYLDLVGITLAGGAGVEGALNESAAIGRGWAFTRIRRTLDTARLTRTTPWTALRQLGEELDVS